MYLLDTNIISELRRPRPHGAVLAWINATEADQLFLSAMTMGEIQRGIERSRPQDQAKAEALEEWADEVASTYQILPIDTLTMRLWARLMNRRPAQLYEDTFIAATAIIHGLSVVTRNTKDFEVAGLNLINPFQYPRQ